VSGPWTFALDTEGPCNGDVLVKTAKGRLVAVIYSTGDEQTTLNRAQAFCDNVPQPSDAAAYWHGHAQTLARQNIALREALDPFARLALWIHENKPELGDADEVQIEDWPYTLGVGQLRRAVEVLGKERFAEKSA
jgi:hypothetical protein